MSLKNAVLKSVWNVVESIKDSVQTEVVKAVSQNVVKIDDRRQIQNLLLIINSSIDASFGKGSKMIERAIDEALKK